MAWKIEQREVVSVPGYSFNLGRGWIGELKLQGNKVERSVEQDGQVIINAPATQTQSLSFVVTPRFKPITLEVRLNKNVVLTSRFEKPGESKTLLLPDLHFNEGPNTLELHAVEGCSLRYQYEPESLDPKCYSFDIQQIQIK